MSIIKKIHKWLSLLIGGQLAVWILSGLVFNLLDPELVSGGEKIIENNEQLTSNLELLDYSDVYDILKNESVINISLYSFFNTPVYRVTLFDRVKLLEASTGKEIIVNSAMARDIAKEHFGDDLESINSISEVEAGSGEIKELKGKFWRVDFNDEINTTFYISSEDGRILAKRNKAWRIFEFFWKLHIMDYKDGMDSNNALVIITAFCGLWLTLTGLILIINSFSPRRFFWVGSNNRESIKAQIYDISGIIHRELNMPFGKDLFTGLAKIGVNLPSNCGGGGTCGQCEVRFLSPAPVSSSDRERISSDRLSVGYRLACQHYVNDSIKIELSDDILGARNFEATVCETKFLTPSIKEVRLEIDGGSNFSFDAGAYMQVEIPPVSINLDNIPVPEKYFSEWALWASDAVAESRMSLRRAYSLANCPGTMGPEIVFNIRIQPPPRESSNLRAGVGSSYIFSLQPGDRLKLKGPFGSFRGTESNREMIFIGGGAGMAPLRSIILDQLVNKQTHRRISFWYGARNKQEIFYREMFDQLASDYKNFSWNVALSDPREGDEWSGYVGFIHQVILSTYLHKHPKIEDCEFFICGPPLMLRATISMLVNLGVDNRNIFFDDFGS